MIQNSEKNEFANLTPQGMIFDVAKVRAEVEFQIEFERIRRDIELAKIRAQENIELAKLDAEAQA